MRNTPSPLAPTCSLAAFRCLTDDLSKRGRPPRLCSIAGRHRFLFAAAQNCYIRHRLATCFGVLLLAIVPEGRPTLLTLIVGPAFAEQLSGALTRVATFLRSSVGGYGGKPRGLRAHMRWIQSGSKRRVHLIRWCGFRGPSPATTHQFRVLCGGVRHCGAHGIQPFVHLLP